ncbi:MAG: glycosyltransferase family 4 protein [Gemmataceae bacterium]|nr:glycosyltransferase family 4 protein [Gemmataceae bacterium]
MGTQPLLVSVVAGVVVQRDAISNVCREQVEALARHGRIHRRPMNIKVYALHTDVPDSRIALARDAATVVCDRHFQESHLIVYHYGIRYPLFDSMLLAPRTARVVVTYQGVTPPALLPAGIQPALYESYRQAVNLHTADLVITASRYTGGDVLRMGVSPERLLVLPNPVAFEQLPDPAGRRPPGRELRLIYLGRFVNSKGVMDTLRAVRAFLDRQPRPVRLELIGSRTFSDPAYLDELTRSVAAHGLEEVARFRFDVSESELKDALLEADALLMPSHHEGFCVPVVEALACGCFVIHSDAAALPETAGGLGRTFPVGDWAALAERLEEFAQARSEGGYPTDSGFLAWAEWQGRARAYAAGFAREQFHERFCSAVLQGVPRHGEEVHACLAEERRRLLVALHGAEPVPCEPRSIPARISESLARAS